MGEMRTTVEPVARRMPSYQQEAMARHTCFLKKKHEFSREIGPIRRARVPLEKKAPFLSAHSPRQRASMSLAQMEHCLIK